MMGGLGGTGDLDGLGTWLCLTRAEGRTDVERAVRSMGGGGCSFAGDAEELRRRVLAADPGACSVAVGSLSGGVSDVNVAAALAQDGNAHEVVLVRRGASGSLRSRAARAGIDRVVDPLELPQEPPRGPSRTLAMTDGAGDLDEPDLSGEPCEGDPEADGSACLDLQVRQSWADAVLSQPDRAPVVTFCSGRGGVGKTAIVAAAATIGAAWDMRVSVVDLDLSCGNLFSCLGLPQSSDLARLAELGDAGDVDVEALSIVGDDGIRVWGPCERPESAELVTPHVAEVLALAAGVSDLVLVDSSTTVTDAVAQAAQRSDRVVLVEDGRPGSIASLARVAGLMVRLGVARTRIARIENRANPRARVNHASGRAEVGLEAARMFRTFEGGPEVADLLGAGEAGDLVELGSVFTGSVATFLAQVLQELGHLPEGEAPRAALESGTRGRGRWGRRREAV